MDGDRYIIQPDISSSSEYQIFDVVTQSVVARGLSDEEARESKNSRNSEWREICGRV